MNQGKIEQKIETSFRKKVRKDQNVKNAYLLVHSDTMGLDLSIAEGHTAAMKANPKQPLYMASVGKLFTSVLIGIFVEKRKLSYEEHIAKYLDSEILHNLHIYKGQNYTDELTIKHLLNHTSGLADNFRPLLKEILKNPDATFTPKEAVEWVKENAKPTSPPGKRFSYTDTNYHLLGLIIEKITGRPFHEALSKYIFEPLKMKNSQMNYYSKPIEESPYPIADFYANGVRLNDLKSYAALDYAGGGVVSTMEDLLLFMKSLVNETILKKDTLEKMKNDRVKMELGIEYGYGIWTIKTVPLVMPKKFNSWGVVGATGAFMFYHEKKDAYIIGTFNDFSYERKGIQFMLMRVMSQLYK